MNEDTLESENYKFESWIPDNKKPYVVFDRNNVHFCIYCGKRSDTREHIPSKVFLNKQYPKDLAVLPACKSCNNSFSEDELYTEIYIDSLKYLSGYSGDLLAENKARIFKNSAFSAFSDAQNDLKLYYESGLLPRNKRLERVFLKLAIGHLIYELSEGYGGVKWAGAPKTIEYYFSFDLNESEQKKFTSLVSMNDRTLPEIGTRIYNNILILDAKLSRLEGSADSNERLSLPLVFLNWTEVQDGNYRYIAWMENDNTFIIRIVIHEFCYAEIVFKLSNE